MKRMFDQVYQEFEFRADTDHLVLFGICADCQRSLSGKTTADAIQPPR